MDWPAPIQRLDGVSHQRSASTKLNLVTGPEGWNKKDEILSRIENRGFAGDKYLRGSTLGCGGWGVVYKVMRVADGKVFAGKASDAIPQLRREAEMLRHVKHGHLLQYVDFYEEENIPEATLVVTQLCHVQTLQDFISDASHGMSRTDVLLAMAQISGALDYLHDRKLFHSDVKPQNVLIRNFKPLDVVLGDCADIKPFGFCEGPFRGTQRYSSPEVAQYKRYYGKSDDMWALGLSLLGMLAQWPSLSYVDADLSLYPKLCFEHVQELKNLNRGAGIVQLLWCLMAWQATRRVSAKECLRMVSGLFEGLQEGDGPFEIKAPGDFKAITFW